MTYFVFQFLPFESNPVILIIQSIYLNQTARSMMDRQTDTVRHDKTTKTIRETDRDISVTLKGCL